MFGFSATKLRLRAMSVRMFHACAGVAFMLMALAAIQYDEFVAPEVARVSEGWAAVAEVGKRLVGLAT